MNIILHHFLSKSPSRGVLYHCGKSPSPNNGLQDPPWSSFPLDFPSNLASPCSLPCGHRKLLPVPRSLALVSISVRDCFPDSHTNSPYFLQVSAQVSWVRSSLTIQNKMASPPSTPIPSPPCYSSLEHLSQSDLLVCSLFVIWSHSRNMSFLRLFPHWFIANACNSASCRFNKYLLNESMQNRLHFSVGISLIVYYE